MAPSLRGGSLVGTVEFHKSAKESDMVISVDQSRPATDGREWGRDYNFMYKIKNEQCYCIARVPRRLSANAEATLTGGGRLL